MADSNEQPTVDGTNSKRVVGRASEAVGRAGERLGGVRGGDLFSGWLGRFGPPLTVILGLLVAWSVYWRFFNPMGNTYFPSIGYTISQTLAARDELVAGTMTTFTEALLGLVAAVVIGISIGVMYSEVKLLRKATLPGLVFGYSLPQAVLAPVFLIWFGRGTLAVVYFVAWLAFFTVLINTMTGFSNVPEEFYHLGEVLGASRWQMIKKIEIWAAMPHITSGIKVAVQQSVVAAIIAEFIATGTGIGWILQSSIRFNDSGLMMGTIIILMTLSALLFRTVDLLIARFTPGS